MSAGKPRLFLLDVEGTIAPISLVTEELQRTAIGDGQDLVAELHVQIPGPSWTSHGLSISTC